ncbi:Protein trichome birefringence-like 5 [Dichanthelium oligosanthes]|uniref:Protein trichome birefringence-like 5 n=1 Tax=Dichanthelium oligosanthes TaxID=888268 RepID=A0A1E5VAX6_9POAL|nr:Protein trichome birefringence-like 5 [Dichanthelium oligosanthes]
MNRNQFESMLCILREALPDKTRMFETHGYRISKGRGYFVFKFGDYDCTVEFVRSHFLARKGVRFNRQKNSNPILQIERIHKTANRWKKGDVLVFNTGHWWTHGKTARGKNYYKEGDTLYPNSTQLRLTGDPSRHGGGDWDSGGSCNGETEPTFKGAIIDSYPVKMRIVEEAIGRVRFTVRLLNVTKLSNFRRDGHPSVYCKAGGQEGVQEEEAGLQPLVPPRRAGRMERAHLRLSCLGIQPGCMEKQMRATNFFLTVFIELARLLLPR